MKKILIVDDDQDILELVSLVLTSNGFNVKTHSNGFNVPDIVLHYHPNLILLDMRIAGKLGNEICKELRALDSKIPIILFSANGAQGDRGAAICGANAFIEKPFDIYDLIATINLHLN